MGSSIGGHRPPLQSPESPLAGLHDPQSQEQVGGSVGKNARSQAAAAISHHIIEHAADEGCEPVGAGMTKSERHGHESKREPAKFAERYLLEVFVDHKAQQEGAPKKFLPSEEQRQRGEGNEELPITSNSRCC